MTATKAPVARVRARHPKLDFTDSPKYWVLGDPQSTHTLNILHYGIPAGERFFIDGVKAAMPYITDPQLLADARGFIGQEASHARLHEKAAERLDLFSIPAIRAGVAASDARRAALNRLVARLPDPARRQVVLLWLSAVAFAEHLTAVLADIALDDSKVDESALDPAMTKLIRWHAAEELEHRSVPYDVYEHVGGTYAMRVATALPGMALVPVALIAVTNLVMLADRDLRRPFSLVRHARAACARPRPSLVETVMKMPAYLLPGHHPSKVGDDRRAAAYLAANPMRAGELTGVRLNMRAPAVVLVTGSGSGIGRALALEFAQDEATMVVATDVDELTARETVDLVRERGGTAHAHRLDVTDASAWEELATLVGERYGVPDVLVNNAGIVVGGSFLDHSAEDWERQLGVNLFGVIHGCRVVGRQMVDRGAGGHIVNIASAAAYTPVPTMPAYCVSKAGVKMLSECLRAELGPHGIGVTAICPGFINTNIGRNGTVVGVDESTVAQGRAALERLQALEARLPVHVAHPREVARAVRAAVRLDLAVVPVRPEAWLGYALSRLSPGLVRWTTRPFEATRAQRLVNLVPARWRVTSGASGPEPSTRAAL